MLILCMSLISGQMDAYNAEATQKLQARISSVKEPTEIVKQPFMKEIEQFLKEGANPNVNRPNYDFGDISLIETLGLFWRTSNDVAALESLFKLMIDSGAYIAIDSEKPGFFMSIAHECPINLIKMAVNAGVDKQQVQKNKEAAVKITKEMIDESDKSIKRMQERIQRHQKEMAKNQNIINELATL